MPAPKRTPDARVRAALTEWRGNVKAAAEALGMSSNNLRKRIELLGLDLGELRKAAPLPVLDPVGDAPRVALPIKMSAQRPRTIRVLPAHQERLRQAKFDLCARWHVETNEDLILAQFIDEAFPAWLAAKMEPKS